MRAPMLLPSALRWARRWGAWLAIPTALNVALWWGWIGPQYRRMAQWQQARQMAQVRPALEALVKQSDQVVEQSRRSSVASSDPQTVMQRLQQLADRHRVQLLGLNVRAASSMPSLLLSPSDHAAKAPIELEARGSFHQLANWIGELETVSGVQLEQWTLTSASEPGQPHHAKLSLSSS